MPTYKEPLPFVSVGAGGLRKQPQNVWPSK